MVTRQKKKPPGPTPTDPGGKKLLGILVKLNQREVDLHTAVAEHYQVTRAELFRRLLKERAEQLGIRVKP